LISETIYWALQAKNNNETSNKISILFLNPALNITLKPQKKQFLWVYVARQIKISLF